jgi:hypothetical protein
MNLRRHSTLTVTLTLAALAGASFVAYVSGALATRPLSSVREEES